MHSVHSLDFVNVQLAVSPSVWNATPDLVMHIILGKLGLRTQVQCRLVSKHWYKQTNDVIKVIDTAFALHIRNLILNSTC